MVIRGHLVHPSIGVPKISGQKSVTELQLLYHPSAVLLLRISVSFVGHGGVGHLDNYSCMPYHRLLIAAGGACCSEYGMDEMPPFS